MWASNVTLETSYLARTSAGRPSSRTKWVGTMTEDATRCRSIAAKRLLRVELAEDDDGPTREQVAYGGQGTVVLQRPDDQMGALRRVRLLDEGAAGSPLL